MSTEHQWLLLEQWLAIHLLCQIHPLRYGLICFQNKRFSCQFPVHFAFPIITFPNMHECVHTFSKNQYRIQTIIMQIFNTFVFLEECPDAYSSKYIFLAYCIIHSNNMFYSVFNAVSKFMQEITRIFKSNSQPLPTLLVQRPTWNCFLAEFVK